MGEDAVSIIRKSRVLIKGAEKRMSEEKDSASALQRIIRDEEEAARSRDADTVDGLHAEEIIRRGRMGSGGGWAPSTKGVLLDQVMQAPNPTTYVCFTFDDGRETVYTNAFPLMKAKGWTGMVMVISDKVGNATYLSLTQLKELRAAGWHFGNHGKAHVNYSTLSRREIELDIRTGKTWVEQNLESPCLFFANPFYSYNDLNGLNVRALIAEFHRYAASGPGVNWNGFPSPTIARYTVDDSTYVNYSTWLAEAKAANVHLILLIHNPGAGGSEISTAHFADLLNTIEASGAQVKNPLEIASMFSNVLYGEGLKRDSARIYVIDFLLDAEGYLRSDPGTSYVALLNALATRWNFDNLGQNQLAQDRECYVRVIVRAVGNEGGNGKGIAIYDTTGAPSKACEVTWNGNSQQNALAGAWTLWHGPDNPGDRILQPYIKGSAASEDITVYRVRMEISIY